MRVAPARWLRAALAAAVVATVCVSVFDLTVSERVVDRAVGVEQQHTARRALAVPEQFSRGQQRGGLVLAELLYAIGIAFIVAGLAILLGRTRRPAGRWLALSAAGAWCLAVVPALALPPLPPGAEAAASIDARRVTFVAAAAIATLGCVAAAWGWRRVGARRPAARLLAAAAPLAAAALIVEAALPADRLVNRVDSSLLRDFRLASFASQGLFWIACAAGGMVALRRPSGRSRGVLRGGDRDRRARGAEPGN